MAVSRRGTRRAPAPHPLARPRRHLGANLDPGATSAAQVSISYVPLDVMVAPRRARLREQALAVIRELAEPPAEGSAAEGTTLTAEEERELIAALDAQLQGI